MDDASTVRRVKCVGQLRKDSGNLAHRHLTVPNTGSWQTWTTIRKTGLSLSAGPQVFRLVLDTNGATGNDYARATPAIAGQTLVIGTQSGKFQTPDFATAHPDLAGRTAPSARGGGRAARRDRRST